ncbi:MAG: DUF1501 domain-containing protein [Planctomycetota bacterium]
MKRIRSAGVNRREAIRLGVLGTGLGFSGYCRAAQAAHQFTEDRSAVLVFLSGGPSHQDTFDLKPDAPAEYRGEFRPVPTCVPGMEICEHLPQLAKIADRYAIVRGISHNLADHGIGTSYLLTGNRPTQTIRYPMYGSVVSHQFAGPRDLPRFVSIDRPLGEPGFLGPEYGPLSTGEKPHYGQPFRVRGISLDDGVTLEHYQSRTQLVRDLDTFYQGLEQLDDQVRSLDEFSRQAFELISSPRCRDAMDLRLEPEAEIARFGKHEFGQSLLMTARLIEAGVRFVTVILEDWDTHQDNFSALAGRLLPPFDQGLSAFLDRLSHRGMLDSTTVMVTGEFGRTPKINQNAGRDHWARAMCGLLAGAGIQPGQVIGQTNDKAEEPAGNAFSPDDLAATFYSAIGINPKTEFEARIGRPITLIRDGSPIASALRQ